MSTPFYVRQVWNKLERHAVINRGTERARTYFLNRADAEKLRDTLNAKASRNGRPKRDGGPADAPRSIPMHKRYATRQAPGDYRNAPSEANLLAHLAEGNESIVNAPFGGWRTEYEPIKTMLKRGYVIMGRKHGGYHNGKLDRRLSFLMITEKGRQRLGRIKR